MIKRSHSFLLNLIEILPLPVFLVYAEVINKGISEQWLGPYLLSSAFALIISAYLIKEKIALNRVILGINLYLCSGAIGLLFGFAWLNRFYGEVEAAGMLFWVLGVCLITLFHAKGLFLPRHSTPKLMNRETTAFIGIVLIACLISMLFQGNRLMSEIIPFIFVFTSYNIFRSKSIKKASNEG